MRTIKKRTRALIILAVAMFFLAIATPQASSQQRGSADELVNQANQVNHTVTQTTIKQIKIAQLDPDNESIAEPTGIETEPGESNQQNLNNASDRNQGSEVNANPAMVVLGNQPIFEIKTAAGSRSAVQRATETSDRIATIANDPLIPLGSIQVGDQGNVTVIFAGDLVLARITEADAEAANTTVLELANQYATKIDAAIASYRQNNQLSPIADPWW
jgi:hypothetical protein